ncbi:MAG: OmpA family protein [Pseudomonadota bacterium]
MNIRNTRSLWMLAAFALASTAMAGDPVGKVYITPAFDMVDDDPDRFVEDTEGFSLTVGYAATENFNFEGFVHSVSFDGDAMNPQDDLELGFNALAVFNRDGWFSPFLLGGLSNLQTDFGGTEDDHILAGSWGGGLMVSPAENFGLRLQYRQRTQFGGPSFSDQIYSVGFQFAFGESTPKMMDADSDGVADSLDQCPNTPIGTVVDARGCELDSDGDGVADSRDKCPNTRRGAEVDGSGCEIVRDTDRDGVSDGDDQCPRTPAGAKVDERGCEVDSDNDSVVDSKDNCPNTAAGVRVDIRGCEIKAVIQLPGVNFESNSDRLLTGAEQVLNDAAATLQKNPDLIVEVAGHTDSDGAAAYNASLSERRAREVRNFLVNAGASGDNLSVRGYGESQPIADNSTADGKAANRRVELRILNQ